MDDQPSLFPPDPEGGPVRRVTLLKDDDGFMVSVFIDDEGGRFEAWLFQDAKEHEGVLLAVGKSKEQALQHAAANLARLASLVWGGMR